MKSPAIFTWPRLRSPRHPLEEALPRPGGGTLHLSGSDISSGCLDLITRNKSPKGMTLRLLWRTEPEKRGRNESTRTNRSPGGGRRWFPGYIVDETSKLGYKLLRRYSFFTPILRMQSWKAYTGIIDFPYRWYNQGENNYYEAYHD